MDIKINLKKKKKKDKKRNGGRPKDGSVDKRASYMLNSPSPVPSNPCKMLDAVVLTYNPSTVIARWMVKTELSRYLRVILPEVSSIAAETRDSALVSGQ